MRHVPHLYLGGDWLSDSIEVSAEQARHLNKVMRLEEGSDVSYTDGRGLIGSGTWEHGVVSRGDEEHQERPTSLTIASAPPKSRDRIRFLVEKLGEVGVESLLWMKTRLSEGRLPPSNKLQAWSVSALEQSRGSWLMEVSTTQVGWNDLKPPVAVCVPGGSGSVEGCKTIVVGPEGGFAASEIPETAIRVGLGNTILRVETAAVAAAITFR